jgi:hypothetical protein
MKNLSLFFVILLLTACGQSSKSPSESLDGDSHGHYQVISQDLEPLMDDFNANQGRVRLMFLNGPTCGICLRGMADLNDAFLAAHQIDDRLVTFVVHVPTMGAKEHHAAESIPLLNGERIHHYWEETGIIGQHYSKVMDVDYYVWDFWAVYGPEVRWDGLLPPVPEYYEHQLGVTSGKFRTFPKERVLEAERFAEKTLAIAESVDAGKFPQQEMVDRDQAELFADGTEIPYVGQPRNVAVRQHIMGRGGYKNLKRIRRVEMSGRLAAADHNFELKITSSRPDNIRREIFLDGETSIAERTPDGTAIDSRSSRGIPTQAERLLLDTYEFDGLFVEWPEKAHEVSMGGMRKFGDVLAWKLSLNQFDGPTWNMFVDSHSGDLIQKELLDEAGDTALIIRHSDFRDVSGFRFPHRDVIAVETIEEIILDVVPANADDKLVTH